VLATLGSGCKEEELTAAEAEEALDQAVLSNKSEALATEMITVTTGFTIGQAVENAAKELHDGLVSQIPCSKVSLEGATVTIDFGTLADQCTYHGHTYAGVATIHVEKDDEGDVVVTHEWTGLTNGDVTLDGDATVTWSTAHGTRRVEHDVLWSSDGHSVHATGDRTQKLLEPDLGLAGGIQIDGERSWDANDKRWSLEIAGVQMRGQDPVPQAGHYTLTNPADKTLELSFERIDATTIQVTVSGTKKSFSFKVKSAG
jgi:hypothetical protein